MAGTLTTDTTVLPCVKCGKNLLRFISPDVDSTVCVCGTTYVSEVLNRYTLYPHRWLDYLRCTCGNVRLDGDNVVVTSHLCPSVDRLVGGYIAATGDPR